MKTIREWLETLDEPYRSQAIINAEMEDERYSINTLEDQKRSSLLRAIKSAFIWSNSPEGLYYWKDLCDNLNETENETR